MRFTEGRVGDCCIVGDGAHGSLKRQPSGVLYLTSKNLKDGKLETSKVDYIDEATFEKFFRENSKALTMPKADDVIFGIIGSIGEAYRVRQGDRFGLSSSIAILRPNRDMIDSGYLYQWVKGHTFQQALYAIKGGVAQGYVSLEMIRSLPLNYPSLTEQRKIAAILSAYDGLIENNTRRIQILEEMAWRIYEEWFVRFRFPGHENVKIVESELGLIPDGWSVKTLDKVSAINGLSVKRGKEPSEILYVDIASVSTGKIDNVQAMPFDKAPGRARRIVKHGDIIWSNVRPNRKSYALVTNPPQNMIVSTGFTVVSASSVPYSFLYQALITEDFASYLTNRAKGAAYPAVGSEDFANAKLIIPSSNLLSVFDGLTAPMQLEKNLLLRKNDVLRRTRDLLLPKLISGEIDVSNFPEPVSD